MKKILMVCLGNICRSPLAEGIMRKKLNDHNINAEVDSCGFESFHTGDRPDQRGIEVAQKNGIDISGHRARLFRVADFDEFDHIFVMDQRNYSDVASVARNRRDMDKVAYPGSNKAVPDPYFGGRADFRKTWEMLDEATGSIIHHIINGKL